MTIGMAVNSGHEEKKLELVALLNKASLLALDLGLWVEGRPFDVIMRNLANQLDRSVNDLPYVDPDDPRPVWQHHR